jgi:hypothetical protein
MYSQRFHLGQQDVLHARLMVLLDKGCCCNEAMDVLWSSSKKLD